MTGWSRSVAVSVALMLDPAAFASPLSDAIHRAEAPLSIHDGRLAGAGGDILRAALTSAQFVVLGEDHGIAQIPALGAALCAELAPIGFRHLAVEVGPSVAPELQAFARASDGPARAAAFVRRYPETIAFYDWKEELAMLAACAQLDLWGLDQELVGATGYVVTKILETKPGPAATAALQALLRDHAAARTQAIKTGDYGKLVLVSGPEAMFEAARDALAKDGTPDARALFASLLESRAIYLGQAGPEPYVSNRRRARLMKATFLDDLSAAARADKAFPKVMIKIGAWHAYRGLNPLHSSEIGNLIAEAAEGHKVEAVNLLVLGVKGAQLGAAGVGRAPTARPVDLTADPDFKMLAPLFSEVARDWMLFDLRTLRSGFRKLGPVDPELERVIFGFDFVVLIPDPKPSHPL
jgi:hypothetical protein